MSAVRVGDERPAALTGQRLRYFGRLEGADRLRRPVKRRIVRGDAHVREHAGRLATVERGPQLDRYEGADLRLCLRDGEPQRQRRRLVRGAFLPQQLVADLRT